MISQKSSIWEVPINTISMTMMIISYWLDGLPICWYNLWRFIKIIARNNFSYDLFEYYLTKRYKHQKIKISATNYKNTKNRGCFHVTTKYEIHKSFCHLSNEMIWESQTLMPHPNIKELHTEDTIRIPTKETIDSKKNNSLNNTRTKKNPL